MEARASAPGPQGELPDANGIDGFDGLYRSVGRVRHVSLDTRCAAAAWTAASPSRNRRVIGEARPIITPPTEGEVGHAPGARGGDPVRERLRQGTETDVSHALRSL